MKCLMNGLEVNYPCFPACALFGDCITAFEKQKKANVRTNADRIRSMSDEELVQWVGLDSCPKDAECTLPVNCEKCWLGWLKQPAKDGENDD